MLESACRPRFLLKPLERLRVASLPQDLDRNGAIEQAIAREEHDAAAPVPQLLLDDESILEAISGRDRADAPWFGTLGSAPGTSTRVRRPVQGSARWFRANRVVPLIPGCCHLAPTREQRCFCGTKSTASNMRALLAEAAVRLAAWTPRFSSSAPDPPAWCSLSGWLGWESGFASSTRPLDLVALRERSRCRRGRWSSTASSVSRTK